MNAMASPWVNTPPPLTAELPLMVQLTSVTVPTCEPLKGVALLNRPPPAVEAWLPLMVQLVSVVVQRFDTPPPSPPNVPMAWLPLMVQLIIFSVVLANEFPKLPLATPPPNEKEPLAVLPLTVQLVSVALAPL